MVGFNLKLHVLLLMLPEGVPYSHRLVHVMLSRLFIAGLWNREQTELLALVCDVIK